MSIKLEKMEDEKTSEKVAEKEVKEIVKEEPKVVANEAPMGFYPIKDLPSRYKLYPEGTIIYGRPLKVLEVKQLGQMTEDNSNSVINGVLRTATKGLNISDLLVADKVYILFWLRANTYKDSGYRVDFDCLKCGQDSNYAFSLESLDVIYLDKFDEYIPNNLPISKDEVILKFQTVRDTNEVDDLLLKTMGNPLEKYDEDLLATASTILSINGEENKSLKQRYNYLVSLDSGDFTVIENNTNLPEIGVSTVINVKCGKCGETSIAGLSFRSEFFIPKYNP